MSRKKLNGSVDALNVYIDKGKQVKGLKAIKQRKRGEKLMLNISKWCNQQIKLKLKDADRPTKRQRLSNQIQRGFDIAKGWKNDKLRTT